MTIMRRFLTTAGLAFAMCGLVHASSYSLTCTVPTTFTAVDISNIQASCGALLTLPLGMGITGADVLISENIKGTLSILNNNSSALPTGANDSVNTTGFLSLTNGGLDIFSPDPVASAQINVGGLAAGASSSLAFNVTATKDAVLTAGQLATVMGSPNLFWASTLTGQSATGLQGNGQANYTDSVQDTITITYQYSATGTPEPGTMLLLGCGVLGLGLIRKRARS